jgi:Ni2+-binding GTPase involved in maturation of urease and hydrogenase
MKLITVAGPPSSGKTSVIIKLIECMERPRGSIGVVKFDCLTSFDNLTYQEAGIPVQTGFSGKICPDHYFVSNIEDSVQWGRQSGFEMLITESAGLCNRCSPYVKGILSICVIDNLAGINTPRKIGPMLKFADVVVVTKGDIVSQAEREVFAFNIRQVNVAARIVFVNGITGQGSFLLAKYLQQARDIHTLRDMKLRFTTPAAVCSYCTGEIKIGEPYQMGMMKKMEFEK